MRIQGLREVTVQEAKNYSNQGYKVEVRETGQKILTKKFEGAEKIRLILLTLAKTIFSLGILPIFSEKTQDQWKALFSGKISIIPEQKFFETEAGKTAQKTSEKGLQLSGKKQVGAGKPLNNETQPGNGKSQVAESKGNEKALNDKKAGEPEVKEEPPLPQEKDATDDDLLIRKEDRVGKKEGDQLALQTLMRNRLFEWVDALDNDKTDQLDSLKKAKIDKEEFKKRLKKRILFLEDNIPDFRRKLEEHKDAKPCILLRDIEKPLDQSIVKVALMDLNEILSLNSQDLRALNNEQLKIVLNRINKTPEAQLDEASEAAKTKTASEELSDEEFFKYKFNLADFLSVEPSQLRDIAALVDPAFFSFLPIDKEADFVKDYDFKSLQLETPEGQEKFRKLFPENIGMDKADKMREILESLTPDQLAVCWKYMPKFLIGAVSLKDVDCSQKEFQDRFDDLFPKGSGYYQDKDTLINTLSPDQINDLWDRFDGPRMSYLSLNQAMSLDLSKFKAGNEKDIERFKGLLFPQTSSTMRPLDIQVRSKDILENAIFPNKDKLAPEFKKMILENEILARICGNNSELI